MPDWRSRLAVSWQDAQGVHEIVPVDSFTPSFSLGAEPLNAVSDTHLGVIYSPRSITFSISVKAIGDSAAQLTALAMNGSRFDIVLQETDAGNDWSFKKIVMSDCIINSAMPTSATVSGAPSATFSGFSLSASMEPKNGEAITIH